MVGERSQSQAGLQGLRGSRGPCEGLRGSRGPCEGLRGSRGSCELSWPRQGCRLQPELCLCSRGSQVEEGVSILSVEWRACLEGAEQVVMRSGEGGRRYGDSRDEEPVAGGEGIANCPGKICALIGLWCGG